MTITIKKFERVLRTICDAATAYDADGWSRGNPLYSHCTVASILAQDIFGGKLLRASLKDTLYKHMRWHYWNILPDDIERDVTRTQFTQGYPELSDRIIIARSRPLGHKPTRERYELLKHRYKCLRG